MKKPTTLKLVDSEGRRLFVVTDKIEGNVYGRVIKAHRGEKVFLTPFEAEVFKDRILEL